jgi:hypothetical protein
VAVKRLRVFALKNPSVGITLKYKIPLLGGVYRKTDSKKARQTFILDKLLWSSLNLRILRQAAFLLEPELSKDYDIWYRNK